MEKLQNALKVLKGLDFTTGNANILKEPLKLAIESLEKQVPKKVTYEGFCPNCNTQYPMYPPTLNKYCGNCGQKLDWD